MTTTDPTFSASDLMGEIIERVSRLEDALEGQPVDDQVEIGSILMAVQDRVSKGMETAKGKIREEAREHLGGPGTHTFSGSGTSEAMVNIPNPSPRVQKDADIDLLRKILGGDFDRYFEEQTTFSCRKEFHERRAAAKDPAHAALIDKYVDVVPHTPRVTFRRMDHASG